MRYRAYNNPACFCAVLESIRTHPEAEEFRHPVDGTRAPDYYDVIEKPMCLWTMKSNVYKGVYKTVEKVCI